MSPLDSKINQSAIISSNEVTVTNKEYDTIETQDLKTTIAGIAGNILEWYDFAIFGYFSDAIGKTFFAPNQNGHAALIKTFTVFGLAFLARPFGGAIIGKYGDTSGRKGALETSILWMAFSTAGMGVLPSYSAVGSLSTVLLVLMRLIQGLSVGGQLTSSVLFTLESTSMKKWGFWGGVIIAATSVGVTIGSVFASIILDTLPEDEVLMWGWRIPFLLGATGALPALYLKSRTTEQAFNRSAVSTDTSVDSDNIDTNDDLEIDPLRETFSSSNKRALMAAILVPTLNGCAYYIIYVWLVIFMESILDPPIPNAFEINSINSLLGGIILTLFGGCFADYVGDYNKIMIWSALVLCVVAPIGCGLIGTGGDYARVVAFCIQLILSFILAIFSGAQYPWFMKLCPPEIRLTTISVGYNVSMSIWGGFAPLVATILADRINYTAPGLLVSLSGLLSLIGLWVAPRDVMRRPESHMNEIEDHYRLM